ncbi:LuxR C-terminal-related transcriptional regulator [Streptomyces sp. NPDC003032]
MRGDRGLARRRGPPQRDRQPDQRGADHQALRAGARGYLLKDLPADDLAHAVRLAHAGVTQLDSSVLPGLAAALPSPVTAAGPAGALSPREIDILRLVARGRTNREIAAQLYLSEGTGRPARPRPGAAVSVGPDLAARGAIHRIP